MAGFDGLYKRMVTERGVSPQPHDPKHAGGHLLGEVAQFPSAGSPNMYIIHKKVEYKWVKQNKQVLGVRVT